MKDVFLPTYLTYILLHEYFSRHLDPIRVCYSVGRRNTFRCRIYPGPRCKWEHGTDASFFAGKRRSQKGKEMHRRRLEPQKQHYDNYFALEIHSQKGSPQHSEIYRNMLANIQIIHINTMDINATILQWLVAICFLNTFASQVCCHTTCIRQHQTWQREWFWGSFAGCTVHKE